MGENSGIQWTTHTFNPWVGCQRVSPGCTNCYAEAYDKRVGGLPKNQRQDPNVPELRWGPKAPRVRTSLANWRKPVAWNAAAKEAGRRDRVFCSSLADVFEDRGDLVKHRLDLFELILKTPELDWLLLTKRPENIARLMPVLNLGAKPWPNVWLGTTVEDQQRADERIPELLKVPAVVRFLSIEPLLEHVELRHLLLSTGRADVGLAPLEAGQQIDWMIIGGESGSNARPFQLQWARELVEQARDVGASPFVKQMGARPIFSPGDLAVSRWQLLSEKVVDAKHCRFLDPHGGEPDEWPEDLRVREFPR